MICKKQLKYSFLLFLHTFITSVSVGQVNANLVLNGSFEIYRDCNPPFSIQKCIGWKGIDSNSYSGTLRSGCYGAVPKNFNTWQYPKSGISYDLSTLYNYGSAIGFLRNRLKQTLKANTTYCVKFYVNIANTSPRGIDGFAAYFADSTLDTITKCNRPLTYLTPQISNPNGNIISDTLNWVPITGTFVATGTEKYMVIGNFKSDAAINTSTINGPFVSQEWTDVCIDDVSCIEMDVAAYAGPDKPFFSGDSVYIGRELDFAVDPYCVWYKLPNMTTAIDTASGIWVKPAATSTFVVRQELECNTVKWDTVVVYEDAVGVEKLKIINEELKISPNPATNAILLGLATGKLSDYFQQIEILDVQGQVLQSEEIAIGETSSTLSIVDLANGIYLLRLRDAESEKVIVRKLAVQR